MQTENEPPDVAREGSGGDPDPGTATTAEDLATLLGVLRIRRGEPSLRTLERRSRAPRPDGVPSVALSRTTVSAILNAERFPTHDVLVALLDALGVAPADQERWLRARARVAETRNAPAPPPGAPADDALSEAARSEPGPPAGVAARPRVRHRWAVGVAAVVAIVLGGLAATAAMRSDPVTGTVACLPVSCAATSPKLEVHGRLSGGVTPDRAAVLLIRVDSTQRWYLGPSVVGEDWSRQVGVGNPTPQAHDRYFTICLDLLPATALSQLAEQMMANAGTGLATADLPADRQELACRPAIRVENS